MTVLPVLRRDRLPLLGALMMAAHVATGGCGDDTKLDRPQEHVCPQPGAPVTPESQDAGIDAAALPPLTLADDSYHVARGSTLSISAPGVLANDRGCAAQASLVAPPARGTLTFRLDGGFDYFAPADGTGMDAFTYRVCSANGECDVATVRLIVGDVAHVIHVSVDGLRPDAIVELGAAALPNLFRFRLEGAFTDNARTDYDYTVTLANHTTQLTGRGAIGTDGHNWLTNYDPAPGQTLHSNNGAYVASVFDVAHDHGLATSLFATKSKFSLYDTSFDGMNGAPDLVSPDDGRDKIDRYVATEDMSAVVDELVAALAESPAHYTFLHLRGPDSAGHELGWDPTPGSPYSDSVREVDALLGRIFAVIHGNPAMNGRSAIVLTSDHGGSGTDHSTPDVAVHYTIPFYAWGSVVARGRDLYQANLGGRRDPGTSRPTYDDVPQPIRNGDAANLALSLLGLPVVSGSHINVNPPLRVE